MKHLTAFLTAAGIAIAPQVLAATATSTFNVTMTIQNSCSITNKTDLDFGTAPGLTTLVDQTSTIEVTCTKTTPYSVGLNAGNNASGGQRRMQGGDYINYDLYSNAGRSTAWGNAAGSWVSGTGTGSAQTLTVYGRVPAQSSPTPGSYSDIVTVTVS